jgi:hypothetical protein
MENDYFWSTPYESHFAGLGRQRKHPWAMETLPDSHHSSLREKLLEHIFIAELMRSLWQQGRRDIEVLRAEVDNGGYDIVICCNGVMRHIQLKAMRRGAKTASVDIQTRLSVKSGGCVIWMEFDPATLALGPFRWFGSKPGELMASPGDKIARHSRGNKNARPALRTIKKGDFEVLKIIDDVCRVLFLVN